MKIKITPETLAVADSYIVLGDISKVSQTLSMPRQDIIKILNQAPIKRYVDTIFNESGYQNRSRLMTTLDDIIDKKLTELDEAELSSKKDIADLLELSHKMRVSEMKMQLDYLKYETETELKLRKLDQDITLSDKKILATDKRMDKKLQFEADKQNAFSTNYEALLERLLRPGIE